TAVSTRSMRASATRVPAFAGAPVAPRTASAHSRVSIGRSMDESIPTKDGRAMKRCMPRILLVEDAPVTQAYLAAVLEALPATVDAVATGVAAMRAVSDPGRGSHALWLVDAHLPDADGADLLERLRSVAPWTPAIAHTASRERREIDALLAAGYERVLAKPVAAGVLREAVGSALESRSAVAEAGTGPEWNVDALRRIFRGELPAQRAAVNLAAKAGQRDGMASVLHRMRASCALVGAQRLDAAVRAL